MYQSHYTEETATGLSSNFARWILNVMGRPIPGNLKFYFKLIILGHILVAAQSFMVLITKWNDFSIKSEVIENLNLVFLSFFTIGELIFFPENIEFLISIIDESVFKYSFPLSKTQQDIKIKAIIEENKILKRFQLIIGYYFITTHILPFLYSLGVILFTNTSCCENIHFSFIYWLPFPLESIFIYLIIAIIQISCLTTMSIAYTCWFVLFNCCLLHIGKEIDILCSLIEETDIILQINNNNSNDRKKLENVETLNEEKEYKLKQYLREILHHHLAILQVVKNVNRTASRVILLYNQFCCIELCLNLYLALVVKDIKRYNYLTTFFIVLALVGMIGNVGQNLSNKGEKLHRVINESSWLNKPNWFKKSIYMMIITAGKPLQIKPGGLFVLNLGNTMKIGQAAYSYFNLLRSVK